MTSIVLKPWGSFQVIEEGEKYLVKKIIVKPKGKLSLQSHEHRSEHWVVVKGRAQVTLNDETKILYQTDFDQNNSMKISHGKKQHVIVKII